MLRLGMFAGAAYAVWRAIESNRAEQSGSWEPQPFPFPPQPRSETTPDASVEDGPKGSADS
jgi:hypothetical protein